jgi:ferredoxin
MSPVRVALDRDRCCGFGLCVQFAPEVFGIDDTGTALLVAGSAVPERQHEACRAAERACPQQVISVRVSPDDPVEQH